MFIYMLALRIGQTVTCDKVFRVLGPQPNRVKELEQLEFLLYFVQSMWQNVKDFNGWFCRVQGSFFSRVSFRGCLEAACKKPKAVPSPKPPSLKHQRQFFPLSDSTTPNFSRIKYKKLSSKNGGMINFQVELGGAVRWGGGGEMAILCQAAPVALHA